MTNQTQPDLQLIEPVIRAPKEETRPSKIFRFLRTERFLHWALAIPYVLLYASALAMALLWNEPHPRHIRAAVSWFHRFAGLCLIVVPSIALLRGRRDWRTHLDNVRHAWTWDKNDFRWLILGPRAAVDRRVRLPEQGKFNAAEKLNFMMVSVSSFTFIATGILVWMPGAALYPWYVHCVMAVLGAPLVAGHIIMATLNPSTRVGLEGMITGWVDREWAKHHYRRWYRERFERTEPGPEIRAVEGLLRRRALIRCSSCLEVTSFESWEALLQRVFRVEPLYCPRCESEMRIVSFETEVEMAEAILRSLEVNGADAPIEGLAPSESPPAPAIQTMLEG
jgi:formate dehydrogenase subunit gamma